MAHRPSLSGDEGACLFFFFFFFFCLTDKQTRRASLFAHSPCLTLALHMPCVWPETSAPASLPPSMARPPARTSTAARIAARSHAASPPSPSPGTGTGTGTDRYSVLLPFLSFLPSHASFIATAKPCVLLCCYAFMLQCNARTR
ncbi:uncharacterized protein K452DRAFT_20414 [Aplosporella prunicola CBS 121167]|uniref:Uncharacterized protein n=1 Tax=Aplosporella prunicola CBS 121167 TaxID=1176127 RepID=A0A6A6BEQ3_9PEZI|nr:uncharacterized protein K452DRAFT_20414 [Aplosporella prunicola CBS 121167]KAF2142546.1 hypothetical protein K452DRAFT_20414 [Aplosporella prunicola CBS 121167]